MNRKGAIEFSANVLVVIIISCVILALGLMLFFNLKSNSQNYVDTIEDQTAQQLKALMLSDNTRVAIYPNDITVSPGKSVMTTIGVTNSMQNQQNFFSQDTDEMSVLYYSTPQSEPVVVTSRFKGAIVGGSNNLEFGSIPAGEQEYKNLLIRMPKNLQKGQYVVTINIINSSTSTCSQSCTTYAKVKLYLQVP